jgi:hypothetical protein
MHCKVLRVVTAKVIADCSWHTRTCTACSYNNYWHCCYCCCCWYWYCCCCRGKQYKDIDWSKFKSADEDEEVSFINFNID